MDDKFAETLKWVCLFLIVGTVIILVIGSCGGDNEGGMHSDLSETPTPEPPDTPIVPYHERSIEELKDNAQYWIERAKSRKTCECATTFSNYAVYIQQVIENKLLEEQLSGQP